MKPKNNSIVATVSDRSIQSVSRSSQLSKRGLLDIGITSKIDELINKLDMQLIGGEFKEAIITCNQILKIDPTNIRATFNIGFCNLRFKRYDQAIKSFNKTLTLDKNHLLAITNKAIALNEIGELSEATRTYEELLRMGQESNNRTVISMALYNLNKYDECILMCNQILDGYFEDLDALFYKSLALMEIKKYSESLKVAEQLLSLQPSNIYALNIIGEVNFLIKNYKESLKAYNLMLEINPNDPNALRGIRKIADFME